MTDLWAEAFSAAVQILTFALGLLGAVAFYWQFQQRRTRRVRFLNRSVLRPWSKVETKRLYKSTEGRPVRNLRLAIPKDAVPTDVDPTVGSEGLEVENLPGIVDGERFLRSPSLSRWSRSQRARRDLCRRASREWEVVMALVMSYEAARERRREVLEPLIAQEMEAAYPGLRPVGYDRFALNTYVIARILGEVEEESDYSLRPGWSSPGFRTSQVSSEDGGYLQIDDGYQLVRISKGSPSDAEPLQKMLISWIESDPVKGAAHDMLAHLNALEDALAHFRDTMKELAFSLDLEFRPEG